MKQIKFPVNELPVGFAISNICKHDFYIFSEVYVHFIIIKTVWNIQFLSIIQDKELEKKLI